MKVLATTLILRFRSGFRSYGFNNLPILTSTIPAHLRRWMNRWREHRYVHIRCRLTRPVLTICLLFKLDDSDLLLSLGGEDRGMLKEVTLVYLLHRIVLNGTPRNGIESTSLIVVRYAMIRIRGWVFMQLILWSLQLIREINTSVWLTSGVRWSHLLLI